MSKWKSKLENIKTGEVRNVEAETKKEVILKENAIIESASQTLPPKVSGDACAWKTVERVVVVDEYRSAPRGTPLKPGRDMPKIERK